MKQRHQQSPERGRSPNAHAWKIDKHNGVHPYDGILLSHEKKRGTGICYTMDGPGRHDAQ
jgi:hypothetical protein